MPEEATSAVAQACAVLGLASDQVGDPKAVKRAYAVMLKRHRPDQDPEGFARVREAYDTLLVAQNLNRRLADENASSPAPGASEPAPSGTNTPSTQSSPEAPQADPELAADHPLRQAITRLEDLVRQRAGGATALLAARQVWTLAQSEHPRLGLQALATAFADQPLTAGEVLGDRGLLLAFEHDHGELADQVLKAWGAQDFQRLMTFASRLQSELDRGQDQLAGLTLRLSDLIALRDPELADDLLDYAFHHLPKEVREITTLIEQRVQIGRLLVGLPSTARRFLWEVLDRDPQAPEPSVPAKVVTELEQLPADHPIRELLRVVLPGLRLGHGWTRSAGMTANPPASVYGRRDSYREAREVDDEGTSRTIYYVVGFVLLMLMAAFLRQPSPSVPTAPRLVSEPLPVEPSSSSTPLSPHPPVPGEPAPQPAVHFTPRSPSDQRTTGTRALTPREREALQKILESGKIPVIQPRRPMTEPTTPPPAR